MNEMSLSHISLSLSPSSTLPVYTIHIPYYDRSNGITISPKFPISFCSTFSTLDQSHS